MKLIFDPHIIKRAFKDSDSEHTKLRIEIIELLHLIEECSKIRKAMSSPQVFISYKREDYYWVKKVVGELEKQKNTIRHKIWIDMEGIQGGNEWWLKIKQAINESALFLSCWSEEAFNQPGYHRIELRHARAIQKKQPDKETFIIPISLGTEFIPEKIKRRHAVEVGPRGWEKYLINAIKDGLERHEKYATASDNKNRPCVCIDRDPVLPEALRRYEDELGYPAINEFGGWCKQLRFPYEALLPKSSLEIEEDSITLRTLGCRPENDDIFVKLMRGANGHLVSEMCLNGHHSEQCDTMEYLREGDRNKVLTAREMRAILRRIRDEYQLYYELHSNRQAA